MAETFLANYHYSHESKEWYTPPILVEAVRSVLGEIDLDPASCGLAQVVVQAREYFSLEKKQNGLELPWFGRIFMNPPYGRYGDSRQIGEAQVWLEKLYKERAAGRAEEGIVLVQAEIYKRWFYPLWEFPICFPTSRYAFWNNQGVKGRSPHASAFIYFGKNLPRFAEVFSAFGPIMVRYK